MFCSADLFLRLVGHLDGLAMAEQVVQDKRTLCDYNLLTHYRYNREVYIDVAKAVYYGLLSYSRRRPATPDELVPHVQAAIERTRVFQAKCATVRHSRPSLFPAFAKVLARYMLHHEWGLISAL